MAVRTDRGRQVVEFMQGGKRIFHRCPPGVTKAQAKDLETKLRRDLFDKQDLGHKEDLTLTGAIGLWLQGNKRKNQRQAISEARQWEPFVAKRLLREAPEVAAEALASWRRLALISATSHGRAEARAVAARVAKASTLNRRLMMLKAVCKWAYKKGLIQENLSPRIETLREPPHKDVYLTKPEVAALARNMSSTTTSASIWLLAYTGLRVSELLALPPQSSRSATLTVAMTKTGKPRIVPVPPAARTYLTQAITGDRINYWALRKEFNAARKKAKLPATVTLHTLRHTAASWLINAGVDLYTVGRILGHSSPQTTARYAHLSTQSLERAMRKLK